MKGAVTTTASAVHIGTQGWNYDAWVGPFYPSGTRAGDYLSVYARAFATVEVDSTFYATPSAKTVQGWAARAGPGFSFALKLPQEITHERRLRDSEEPAQLFFERVRGLGNALGPVLVQLGPDFSPTELSALVDFLALLPRGVRVAVEFRQRGWLHDGVLALLAEHNVALAFADARWMPRRTLLALAERPTADFLYIRLIGADREITEHSRIQADRTRELEAWAAAITASPARHAFVYAGNHFAGHAPATARQLQRLLGQRPVEPADLTEQITLF